LDPHFGEPYIAAGLCLRWLLFFALIVVWRATREFMISVLANVIGIVVTLLFKIILLIFIRKMLFVGFFRTQPLGGNILLLILGKYKGIAIRLDVKNNV
jgi:hypothetical protein